MLNAPSSGVAASFAPHSSFPSHLRTHTAKTNSTTTTTTTTTNTNKFEFPIDVGKTLRVMDLNGKKIVVRNLAPGDERVEIFSSTSFASSSTSSLSSQLRAEKLDNGDVYVFTVSSDEDEMRKNGDAADDIIECKIPPRFVSLDVLMGNAGSLTVDANVAEASVDVTVVNEDEDETDARDRTEDDVPSSFLPPPAHVRFLKSVKGAYVNVETLNGDVSCETIQANATIKTNGGNVIAKRVVANDLRVDAGVGGNILIDSVFVHDCELYTTKGEIRAKKNFRASGTTKCITNGGNVSLENVECGDEDAEVTIDARSGGGSTDGGDISIQFAPRVTNIHVYTNNTGSIDARVPSGFPALVVRREENQPDEIIVPAKTKKEDGSSFGETSGEGDEKSKDVSTLGARIVHDVDDSLARKIRAEYESKSNVIFSLGGINNNDVVADAASSKKEEKKKSGSLSLVETSWLDEVFFKNAKKNSY
jgi:hypothetical protein